MQDDLIIDAARRQIVTAGIKMVEQKMIAGSWGNLSIKIDTSRCAITPSGRSYDSLNTEDIVVVDMQGNKIKGALIPSSETPLHLAIYNAIPAAQAIPALIEDLVQIIGGSVDVAEYALPGTKVLAENALIALQNKKAALLANHGVVCWGNSLETALMAAEIVEKAAHIYCICETMGGAKLLPESDIAIMHDFYKQHYSKRQIEKGDEVLE